MYISDISANRKKPSSDPAPVVTAQPAVEPEPVVTAQPAAHTFAASQPYPDAEKAEGLAAHYSEEAAPADFTSTEALEKKYEDPKPEETEKAKPSRRIPLRIARNYLIVAVICAAVGVIYELFSHQVWSVFMIGAFAVPLILGVLPNLVIAIGRLKTPSLAAENLYACGLVTLTLGSLLKGVLQIYGTTNELLDYYWLVGAGFACLGIIFYFAQKKPVKRS